MRPSVDIEAVYRKYVCKNLDDCERRAMELAISYIKTAGHLTTEDIFISIGATTQQTKRDGE